MIKIIRRADTRSAAMPEQPAIIEINGVQFASKNPRDAVHADIINAAIAGNVARDLTEAASKEINPGNEALTQLRPYWEKILVIIMRMTGLKEITIDQPEIQAVIANPPTVVVLGRKKLGPDKGFTLVVADNNREATEILAKHQGQG